MKPKILVENDVFWEDEKDSRNTSKIAFEYFDVIEVNSILEINEKNLNEPLVMYRGSFAVGSCLYRTYRHLFQNESSFFNCLYWVPALKQYYINKRYNIVDMESCLDLQFPLFIRPCGGNKTFSGQLFSSKAHYETEYKFTVSNRNVSKNTLCLYAKPKKIVEEYRCVFVDKKLVASCGYLSDGERKDFPSNQQVIDKANEIANDEYFNIPNFVIDVCRDDLDNFYLLEINSIQNASFYSCDLHSIYKALSEYFKSLDSDSLDSE